MLIYAMVTLGSLTLWDGCSSFAVPISTGTKSELRNSTSDDVNKMAVIPEPKVQTNITRKEEQLSGRVLYYTKTITEPRIPLTLSEELGILTHVNKSKLLLTNSPIIISQFSKIQQNQHMTQSTTYKEQFRLQDAKGHEQTSYTGTNSSKSQHLEGRYNETQFKSTNQSNITEAKPNVQNKYEKARVYSIYDLVSGNHDIIEKKESSFLGHTENKNNSKTMGNVKENENTTKIPAKESKLSANPRGTAAYQHKAKKTDAHDDYKKITVLYNLYSLVAYVANQENEQISLKTNMNQHNVSIIENKNFKKFSALRVLYSLVSYVANQKYEQTEKTNSLNEDKNHTNSEGEKVHDVGIIEEQKYGKRVKKRQNVEGGNSASFISYTISDQSDNTNNPNLDRLESSVKTEEPSLIQEVKGYLKSYGWRGYLIIAVSVVIGLTAILFLVGFIAKICRWHKNHKQLTKLQHLIHPASI